MGPPVHATFFSNRCILPTEDEMNLFTNGDCMRE